MNTKHTPGSWVQKSEIGLGPRLLIYANDALIAKCTSIEDARLIAAAPDLLEVLKEARYKIAAYAASDAAKWTSDVEKINAHSAQQCQEIDAIIAKATTA